MEIKVNNLSDEELRNNLDIITQSVQWKEKDAELREAGHNPVSGNFAGQSIHNENNYIAISQDYGEEVALISLVVNGEALGTASFFKINQAESQDSKGLQNFWQRLLNALLESSSCLPICSLKAVQCGMSVNWGNAWFIVAKDLITCVLSKEECKDCLIEAFKKAFHS